MNQYHRKTRWHNPYNVLITDEVVIRHLIDAKYSNYDIHPKRLELGKTIKLTDGLGMILRYIRKTKTSYQLITTYFERRKEITLWVNGKVFEQCWDDFLCMEEL